MFFTHTGQVLNVIPGQREALRVSPAETRLTVYRRRLLMKNISPQNDEIWSKNIFHQMTLQ